MQAPSHMVDQQTRHHHGFVCVCIDQNEGRKWGQRTDDAAAHHTGLPGIQPDYLSSGQQPGYRRQLYYQLRQRVHKLSLNPAPGTLQDTRFRRPGLEPAATLHRRRTNGYSTTNNTAPTMQGSSTCGNNNTTTIKHWLGESTNKQFRCPHNSIKQALQHHETTATGKPHVHGASTTWLHRHPTIT